VPLAVICAASTTFQVVCCAALAWQLFAMSPGPGGEWLTLIQVAENPLSLGGLFTTLLLPSSIIAAIVLLQRSGHARVVLAASIVVLGCYTSARPAAALLTADPVLQFYPPGGFGGRLLPGWTTLERHAAPGGANVAYSGTNLPYYLYGIGLRNRVRYVDVTTQQDPLPHAHHQRLLRSGAFRLSHDPYPEWHRAGADFDAWTANLRRHEIEFLFVARENRHGRLDPYPGTTLPAFPIEKQWADAHPALFEDLGPFEYAPGTIPWVRVYRFLHRTAD
jgi:hypothetical protein